VASGSAIPAALGKKDPVKARPAQCNQFCNRLFLLKGGQRNRLHHALQHEI
jgi:hypothetical protein